MDKLVKSVLAIDLAIVVLQICVLAFGVYRWNEIIGSILSIVVSILGCFLAIMEEFGTKRSHIGFYALTLGVDLIIQTVNVILLICFQWVVIEYCIHLNLLVNISEYEGVVCNDWWHFGYGEINYRDRAMIVTILLVFVIILRLVQIGLTCAAFKKRASPPMFVLSNLHPKITSSSHALKMRSGNVCTISSEASRRF